MMIVGSRGDVQPFIAFALELQREGYVVKIATHEVSCSYIVLSIHWHLPIAHKAHKKFVEEWNIQFVHLAGSQFDQ